MNVVASATRREQGSRIEEIAEFLKVGSTELFCFAHLPRGGQASAGVVICSPVYAEFTGNYRREVLIGRRLAENGIAVQRFHYRGQGNSGGASDDTTFASMVEDGRIAAERLCEIAGVERLGYFGGRLGALVAAHLASEGGDPVAAWDPAMDGRSYFADIHRARRVQALRGGGQPNGASLEQQLATASHVPILGYTITRNLYESVRDRNFRDELTTRPRRVMILRTGRDPRRDREVDRLLEEWRSEGLTADAFSVSRPEAWWFSAGEQTTLEAAEEARRLTTTWFADVFGAGAEDG